MTGTFPSGGSTIIDCRRAGAGLVEEEVSPQCEGGLTPGSPAGSCGTPGVSNGVLSKFTQVPCKSGWPSAVRAGLHTLVAPVAVLDADAGAWAFMVSEPASAIAAISMDVLIQDLTSIPGITLRR
jgi:hypothetical protein